MTAGEVDWLELPSPDLMPMLKRASGVTTGLLDIYGTVAILRPNSLIAPTSNVGVRKAMMAAVDPREAMIAAMGEDESGWRAPMGYFLPGSPAANDAGMEFRRKRWSTGEVKAMLDKAGYGGERIVLLHPTDQLIYNAFITVVADAFRKVGLNIDEQMVDWGTVVQRRTNKETVDKGGWSIFPAGAPGAGVRRSDAGEHAAQPRREGMVRLAGRSEDRGGVRGMDRCAERCRAAQARGGVPGGGVRLRADDPAWAVPAAGGMAIECDRIAEGIGAGVLGRGQGVRKREQEISDVCRRQWGTTTDQVGRALSQHHDAGVDMSGWHVGQRRCVHDPQILDTKNLQIRIKHGARAPPHGAGSKGMVDRDHGVPNPGINVCVCVDLRPWRYFTPTEWVQGCSIGEMRALRKASRSVLISSGSARKLHLIRTGANGSVERSDTSPRLFGCKSTGATPYWSW